MKRFSEQLQKKSANIRLKAAEKQALRERVVSYMEYHPLPKSLSDAKSTSGPVQIYNEAFKIIKIPAFYLRSAFGALLVFVMVGVPVLAEQAVPGDVLYPIKVRVTEEIRGSMALSSYDKVAWETERLERRIAEARVLAKNGRLTPETEAGVVLAIRAHQDAAEKQIETMRLLDEDGASLAKISLASTLDIQSAILRKDDSSSSTSGKSTGLLAGAVEAGKVEANLRQEEAVISYERLMARLEQETTRTYELLRSLSRTAPTTQVKEIERRLEDIERKIGKAEELKVENESESKSALRFAYRDVQKLIAFMTNFELNQSMALEELVPVVLTDEEKTVLIQKDYDLVVKNLHVINMGLASVTEAAVRDKISLTINDVEELLKTASSSLATSDIELAELSAKEALAYTESMLALATFTPSEQLGTSTPQLPVEGNSTSTVSGEVNASSSTSTTGL